MRPSSQPQHSAHHRHRGARYDPPFAPSSRKASGGDKAPGGSAPTPPRGMGGRAPRAAGQRGGGAQVGGGARAGGGLLSRPDGAPGGRTSGRCCRGRGAGARARKALGGARSLRSPGGRAGSGGWPRRGAVGRSADGARRRGGARASAERRSQRGEGAPGEAGYGAAAVRAARQFSPAVVRILQHFCLPTAFKLSVCLPYCERTDSYFSCWTIQCCRKEIADFKVREMSHGGQDSAFQYKHLKDMVCCCSYYSYVV